MQNLSSLFLDLDTLMLKNTLEKMFEDSVFMKK